MKLQVFAAYFVLFLFHLRIRVLLRKKITENNRVLDSIDKKHYFEAPNKSVVMFCRRVVRPWLGLKMIDLNEMIIAQLKERDPRFPNVDRGVLVPMVCLSKFLFLPALLHITLFKSHC